MWEGTSEKLRYMHLSNLLRTITITGGFPGGIVVSYLLANAGDTGDADLIPESGRYPGGGNGNPLPYSCLENSMVRGVWWVIVHGVAKNWT